MSLHKIIPIEGREMIHTLAIRFRPGDEGAIAPVRELRGFIGKLGVRVILPVESAGGHEDLLDFVVDIEEYLTAPELVLSIGGDGTFLRTARMFVETGQPIMGVNKGTLGFLTEFSPEEYLWHLPEIMEGNFSVTQRSVMQAVHIHEGAEKERSYFINDAVLSKGAFSRAINLRLELDGEFLNSYSGDGLIIATPTGSTAYSLSAGGPIISPQVHDVYLLNPVNPHSLTTRPIVIPGSSKLKARIVTELKNLLLTIDGQEAIEIEGNDEVLFQATDRKVNLITHPEKSFYSILREKLNWGK
jgi:NAD+ kinase